MNSDPRSVEDELTTLKINVAVILSNYATKSDLQGLRLEQKSDYHDLRLQIEALRVEIHDAFRKQTWKMIGLVAALVAASHVATRFGY
ncbi:hypothetical protein Q4S45_07815 [Massilia sp. R2A-15]|uniref:hypothetical protein n=1 Tax=Massilia sp. R2A-15 TaxID=3064278 RepID=UPI00273758F7|nr:hypothetical protein [Massilia sp. R2A-15]WLI91013.1 hypothetical protein Q4S45_07815 [Massilia sp. R2A-15]